ncbi:MAG: (S)-ureidoglycine aminohydrolase [Phycisphaerae bacterium]|nr:(S)-ureidoglycine aminohydrolase [Phycisphaerae bacterium]
MRTPTQLVHTRTRVRDRYAVMPLEGFPPSRLPRWKDTEARILAAPALGAQFVEVLLSIKPGGGAHQPADDRTQSFFYLLTGGAELTIDGHHVTLGPGGYAYIPHGVDYTVKAPVPTSLLLLKKRFEPASAIAKPEPFTGNIANVPADPWMENSHARLQVLIPDELTYDFAMNIFSFDPGFGLPYVETHVMEHGLYFLEGKGVYFLGDEWLEVEATDFIYMAPYCPQSFYASGPTPAKYLYYKNVNRDINL